MYHYVLIYLRLTISPVEINISFSQAWLAGQTNHVSLSSSTSSKSVQAHQRFSVESVTIHYQMCIQCLSTHQNNIKQLKAISGFCMIDKTRISDLMHVGVNNHTI